MCEMLIALPLGFILFGMLLRLVEWTIKNV